MLITSFVQPALGVPQQLHAGDDLPLPGCVFARTDFTLTPSKSPAVTALLQLYAKQEPLAMEPCALAQTQSSPAACTRTLYPDFAGDRDDILLVSQLDIIEDRLDWVRG